MALDAKNPSERLVDTASPTYYVSDYSKFSVSELWKMTNANPFRWLYVSQLVFAKMTGRSVRTAVPSLNDNLREIELSEIPEKIRSDITPSIRSLQLAGFRTRLVQTMTRSRGNFGYGVHLVSADRLSVAAVLFARVFIRQPPRTEVAIGLVTHRQNGQIIVTSNAPARLEAPPEMRVERLVGATADQLAALHRKRILDCTDAILVDDVNFADRIRVQARRIQDFHVARGFYVPANPEEMIRYRDQIIAPGVFEFE